MLTTASKLASRNGSEATSRLGIRWPTLPDLAVGVAAVIPAFMLSLVGSLLTLYFQPDVFEDLGDTMEEMASGSEVTLVSVLIFASAGLGEEILRADLDRIEASYEAGVIRLTVPVAEKAKPRKIQLQESSENGRTAIEA